MGCAVLGIGIWLQVSKGSYASIIPNVSFLGASVLCIVAGVMILIIGFFGCCGAIMESQCMLITVCACFTIGCDHTAAVQPVATCRQSPYLHKPAVVIVTLFSL